ncbi:PrgI family protein [Spirillospora sp. NPDC127200]
MSRSRDEEALTARIPADIDQPDKLLYGLTARQIAVLAVTGLGAVMVYLAAEPWLPLAVVAGLLLPIVAAGGLVAIARHDGMSLDRFALAALLHWRTPEERVPAGDGVSAPPAWCRVRGQVPAPLRLPVRAVRGDGVLELDGGGVAVLVQATTISFGLRTAGEQAALVGAFGRWLNSLDTPVQILVQSRPVELAGLADHIAATATGLPDPGLRQAALDHAAYLAEVDTSYDLLGRQVLLVIRDNFQPAPAGGALAWPPGRKRDATREAGAAVVVRRAEEAVRALGALGITAHVLDAAACTQALADSLSPGQDRLLDCADPGEVITAQEATP